MGKILERLQSGRHALAALRGKGGAGYHYALASKKEGEKKTARKHYSSKKLEKKVQREEEGPA